MGYQSWRDLLFLHWPVPAEALRPLVPARLSLDLYEGMTYVGLIPFAVERARWVGMPAAFGLTFLETNVRTYVHLEGQDPGVFFFSLDAASMLAVLGARIGFGLPYFPAVMRLRRDREIVEYAMRRWLPRGRRPSLRARYQPGEALGASRPGTLEHFLIERYLLHAERPRGGRLWTTRVHHAPYPFQQARLLALQDELVGAAGLPVSEGPPPLVHYASGVDVEIFAPRPRGRYSPFCLH